MTIDLTLIGDISGVAVPAIAMAFHPCAVSGIVSLCQWAVRKLKHGGG